MSAIQAIGGAGGPSPERPSDVRNRQRETAPTEPRQDGVEISGEAREAAETARLQEVAREVEDVRTDRVQEARAALERGEFQDETVLRQVAQRILRILD